MLILLTIFNSNKNIYYFCNIVAFITLLQMKSEEILNKYNLKLTGCRKMLVNTLLESSHALSEHEIKDSIGNIYDRITIYRTLKTLEENNIIHKITFHDSCTKYAVASTQKYASHIHCHCNKCHQISCIDSQITTDISLPSGYKCQNISVVLDGICSTCNQ